jgi:predicted Zn-dependent protease
MIRTSRGTVVAIALAMAVVPVLVSACSAPYDVASEKLKKPTKKAKPPEPPPTETAVKYDEDCKTKFEEDAKNVRRRSPQSQIDAGDSAITSIDSTPDPATKAGFAVDAINKYKNALAQDPYSSVATYKLAVAYALVLKKGCALALLKRLTVLQKHPDFEADATRMIKSVDGEPAFKGFHKDALTAAGQ